MSDVHVIKKTFDGNVSQDVSNSFQDVNFTYVYVSIGCAKGEDNLYQNEMYPNFLTIDENETVLVILYDNFKENEETYINNFSTNNKNVYTIVYDQYFENIETMEYFVNSCLKLFENLGLKHKNCMICDYIEFRGDGGNPIEKKFYEEKENLMNRFIESEYGVCIYKWFGFRLSNKASPFIIQRKTYIRNSSFVNINIFSPISQHNFVYDEDTNQIKLIHKHIKGKEMSTELSKKVLSKIYSIQSLMGPINDENIEGGRRRRKKSRKIKRSKNLRASRRKPRALFNRNRKS